MESLMCNSTMADPNRSWCLKSLQMNHMVVCYQQTLTRMEGLWRAENAANHSLPTLLLQLILIIIVNRVLMIAFRYLRLPRIAAEILGGVLLGATWFGETYFAREYAYPFRGTVTLETVANLGLLYYMFLVGLEVDMRPIVQAPKKALGVALAGFLVPFPVGYALHYYLVVENFDAATKNLPTGYGPLFWGLALCTTNFPDLAQILEDLKLLRSEVGRTALSAAVITDFISWILLVLVMAVVNNRELYTVVFSIAFVIITLFAIRPALAWMVKHITSYEDCHISFILALVVAFGYATGACGCHSIFGGFMLGLIIPKGELKEKLKKNIEDFVSGQMMPLFFVIIGLRTNFRDVFPVFSAGTIVAVWALVFMVKIGTTFVAAVFINKMKVRDALSLGVLMNTKGLLTLIVISTGRDLKVLNTQTFGLLIVPLWLITLLVQPTFHLITYRSERPGSSGMDRKRTVASLDPDSEFRILTCFHGSREVNGLVNLLAATNPTKNSPVCISAAHLVENVGRASAMLIVNDASHVASVDLTAASAPFSVEALTAVSDYPTMHVEVCSLAREKRAALILLPFHLRPGGGTDDGAAASRSSGNPVRVVNSGVMDHAECSVAVFVDRGGGHRSRSRGIRVMMIFVGGPDDREALALVGRMAGGKARVARVSVARIVSGGVGSAEEKVLDERCVEEFRHRMKGDKGVIVTETAVESGDEIAKMMNMVEGEDYDLVIVGKGRRASLDSDEEWCGFPELGLLGDSLVCSAFAPGARILVVQQGTELRGKLEDLSESATWQPLVFEGPDLAPFVGRGNMGA